MRNIKMEKCFFEQHKLDKEKECIKCAMLQRQSIIYCGTLILAIVKDSVRENYKS